MNTPLPKTNQGAAIGMLVMVVLVAGLGAFNQALGSGQVPVPEAWKWICVPLTVEIEGSRKNWFEKAPLAI